MKMMTVLVLPLNNAKLQLNWLIDKSSVTYNAILSILVN